MNTDFEFIRNPPGCNLTYESIGNPQLCNVHAQTIANFIDKNQDLQNELLISLQYRCSSYLRKIDGRFRVNYDDPITKMYDLYLLWCNESQITNEIEYYEFRRRGAMAALLSNACGFIGDEAMEFGAAMMIWWEYEQQKVWIEGKDLIKDLFVWSGNPYLTERTFRPYEDMSIYRKTIKRTQLLMLIIVTFANKNSTYIPRDGSEILDDRRIVKLDEYECAESKIMIKGANDAFRQGLLRQSQLKMHIPRGISSIIITVNDQNEHVYQNNIIKNGLIVKKNILYPILYIIMIIISIAIPIGLESYGILSDSNIDTIGMIFTLLVVSSTILPVLARIHNLEFDWTGLVAGIVYSDILEIKDCYVCLINGLSSRYDITRLLDQTNSCAIADLANGKLKLERGLYPQEAFLLGKPILIDVSRQQLLMYNSIKSCSYSVNIYDISNKGTTKAHCVIKPDGEWSRPASILCADLIIG
jgi:hypothetical protein